MSVTSTPVAASGPSLATVSVKVTLLPKFGAALSTVFARLKSACFASTEILAWSSSLAVLLLGVESVSATSEAVISALFDRALIEEFEPVNNDVVIDMVDNVLNDEQELPNNSLFEPDSDEDIN